MDFELFVMENGKDGTEPLRPLLWGRSTGTLGLYNLGARTAENRNSLLV